MSNTEHNGKHFVIQKGKAMCDKGTSFPNFKVTSHQKHYWNDADGKEDYLAVTEDDVQFNPVAVPFGNCSVKNGQPCSFAPVGKWEKSREKLKIMEKSALLETSYLMCSVGGKITIQHHGQSVKIGNSNLQRADAELMNQILPGLDLQEIQAEEDENQYYS